MEMETCLPRMTQSGQDLCTQDRVLGVEAALHHTAHAVQRGQAATEVQSTLNGSPAQDVSHCPGAQQGISKKGMSGESLGPVSLNSELQVPRGYPTLLNV